MLVTTLELHRQYFNNTLYSILTRLGNLVICRLPISFASSAGFRVGPCYLLCAPCSLLSSPCSLLLAPCSLLLAPCWMCFKYYLIFVHFNFFFISSLRCVSLYTLTTSIYGCGFDEFSWSKTVMNISAETH